MPWDVKKDDRCPSSKPWGVVQQGSGDLEGCHPSQAAAKEQQKALYANEPRGLTTDMLEARAEWDSAYINDLPDSAFACIDAGGEKDEDGKTTPRSLRHYPHHNAAGDLDMPHLNAAWSRVNQDATTSCGKDHLAGHRKSEGMGDRTLAKTEKRFAIDAWQTGDWQIRAEDDGMTFTGYAAVFNQDSDGPIPGFGIEQIAPGAFAKSLKAKRDIKMFLNHNADLVLASREAGTLELAEDDIGLLTTAHFIDTTVGIDTAKNVKAGNVRHMSFGFNPVRTKARSDGVAGTIHTDTQLWEVSPVTAWPAYKGTSAFVRHLAEAAGEDPDALSEVLMQLDALAEQRIAGESEAVFTDEQYDLAIRVINIFRGSRLELAPPLRSRWEERIAALPQ